MKSGQGELLEQALLSAYTTWRIGGRAKYLYKPKDISDLAEFLKNTPNDLAITWLGLGSNALVRDGGFNGLVILPLGRLNHLKTDDNLVYVEAGVSCASMARFCARNNLANAEFWAGIPGTMGGALRMNAGCFGGETWDNLVFAYTINRQGEIKKRSKDSFEISYRHISGLANDEWFVGADFLLAKGDKKDSLSKIKNLLQKRSDSQPTGEYNCGSVFRNPENLYAAKLIESCGLKGFRLGGAEVSLKHANFIINRQKASASDIENLIIHVRNTVLDETGITLKQEVHIIGDKA